MRSPETARSPGAAAAPTRTTSSGRSATPPRYMAGAARWAVSLARMSEITCSFCGKTRSQVKALVSGPAMYICDECIFLCLDILEEKGIRAPQRRRARSAGTPARPDSQLLQDLGRWCKALGFEQLYPSESERWKTLPRELLSPGGAPEGTLLLIFQVTDIGLACTQAMAAGVRMAGTVRNLPGVKAATFLDEKEQHLVLVELEPSG